MKKNIIFLMTVLCIQFTKAQNITILDQLSNEPIVNVKITCLTDSNETNTNNLGQFDLSTFPASTKTTVFSLLHPEYQFVTMLKKDFKDIIYMERKSVTINEFVYSINKTKEEKNKIPQQIELISKKQINFQNPQSTGDMLMQTGNVFVQTSQYGGSSPVLRGFEANRILLVVDGVRMNNAVYRGGHLQNCITIDPNMLDRTEIVFGPGSTVYGSDALGGVIHFYSRNPILSTNNKTLIKGDIMLRAGSVSNEISTNTTFNIANKKIASLTSITYKTFGDLNTGSMRTNDYPEFGKRTFYITQINGQDTIMANANVNKQIYSGYNQLDIIEKILFKLGSKTDLIANLQYSNSSDIPRFDRLNDSLKNNSNVTRNNKPRWAEWYYGPQKRLMGSLTLNLGKETQIYNSGRIIVAYQDIEESRIQREYKTNNKDHRIENIKVMSFNADFSKKIKKLKLFYGGEFQGNNVQSTAYRLNIVTNEKRENITTRYPGKSNLMNYIGIYQSSEYNINSNFKIVEGARINIISQNSVFSDSNQKILKLPFSDINLKSNQLCWNIGAVYYNSTTKTGMNISTGFRAPNLDDATKFFDSKPGAVIVVPNANLAPEKSINYEIFFNNILAKKLKFDASIYYTTITNYIGVSKFIYNGSDSIVYDGKITAIQANQNIGTGNLWGYNLGITFAINKNWNINTQINQTKGKLTSSNTPLDHIPPMFGKFTTQYQKKKIVAELYILWNAKKSISDYRLGAEDNEVYATPDGSLGWYTINIKGEYKIHKNLKIQLGIENLLDKHYRLFASGISAPGRNIYLALRAQL